MTSNSLDDIRGLQKDVVDLLEQVSQLMDRAHSQLGPKDDLETKYAGYRDQIAQEAYKVKNLELRMAIAAPMKAGKSTIINAILGQEILPSRNAAMTAIPTEIVLERNLKEPILTLDAETLSIFKSAWSALKKEIKKLGDEGLRDRMGEYPHLLELANEVETRRFPFRASTAGCQAINKVLSGFNDIVRLCAQLTPYEDPLGELRHVPKIETPFWEFQADIPVETLGKLVIVDTPGPNEAGGNLRLVGVVEEQLQKSSLVLIVLDYTQLKTKAAEDVKNDVKQVIKIRGKENLYILVNKIDQRRDKDMTSDEVKQFVSAEFGLDLSELNEHMFEISARKACAASIFKQEIKTNSAVNLHELQAARSLAQEVFGVDWEEELEEVDTETLEFKADRLWSKSGFSPFLSKAIAKLMAEAAPRCMQIALVTAQTQIMGLLDSVNLRRNAISKDAKRLKAEIGEIQKDLDLLNRCHSALHREKELKKNELHKKMQVILQEMKALSVTALEQYFLDGLSSRLNDVEKLDLRAKKMLIQPIKIPVISSLVDGIIPSSLASLVKYKVVLAGRSSIKFKSRTDAEKFAEQVFLEAKQIIEKILADKFSEIQFSIRKIQIELKESMRGNAKEIIGQARKRLNHEFDIELSLPQIFLMEDLSINTADLDIEILKKERTFFQHIVDWFKALFGIENPREKFYVVSLEDMIKQVDSSIERKIEETQEKIDDYLKDDFESTTNLFFCSLDNYLLNYQASLKQALDDQSSSMEDKDELTLLLNTFIVDSKKLLHGTNRNLNFVEGLIPSNKKAMLSR